MSSGTVVDRTVGVDERETRGFGFLLWITTLLGGGEEASSEVGDDEIKPIDIDDGLRSQGRSAKHLFSNPSRMRHHQPRDDGGLGVRVQR
jgi:hypothetical protein